MTPLDIAYLTTLGLTSPWLARRLRSRNALYAKFTGSVHVPEKSSPRIWFHGVSVGEIHLLRNVIAEFVRRRPDCDVVVSSSTDTGIAEARKTFPDHTVIAWPFDFSWAVRKALRSVRPDLIVLAESELWPGMLAAADAARVPVVVINGRLSPNSARHYRQIAPLARGMFNRVAHFGMQTAEYAQNLISLGVPRNRITTTGSVKFDGVETNRANPKTAALRQLFNIQPHEIVWVAGSTQDPEEQGCIEIYKRLKAQTPNLRLILVPRQKDRFDPVAKLLTDSCLRFARRSELSARPATPGDIILVDTIGELRAVWGLADIAFVGGSLDGQRGGQNMIEPAAYGSAVIFGPHVWNFKEVAHQLLTANGAQQIADFPQLESAIQSCLQSDTRQSFGQNAQAMVLSQQGATERTLAMVDRFLPMQSPNVVRRAG